MHDEVNSTCLYADSDGLCFWSQSLKGLSLKEPVSPCSVWIALRVADSVTISSIPGRRGERERSERGGDKRRGEGR